MGLDKRFLHTKRQVFQPKRQEIIIGLILGFVFAVMFYSLLYYYKEILRFIRTDNTYYDIVILSPEEFNFYNLICAFISCIFGQSVTFTYWLNKPRRKYGKLGYKLNSVINDLWPLNLVFLGMFTRLVGNIGLIYFWDTNYEFGLYPDFNIYFILAVIVLFLQQWVTIGRIFKRKGIKWMVISAVVISTVSFGMSRVNFYDYEAVNKKYQNKNVYYKYYVDCPVVENTDAHFLWSHRNILTGNIYIVNAKNYPADTQVYVLANNYSELCTTIGDSKLHEINPDSLKYIISKWEQCRDSTKNTYRRKDREVYNLKLNRNIPMSFVNRLKTDLLRSGVKNVKYAVQPIKYQPGENFRMYDDWLMLRMVLPDYYLYNKDDLKAFYQTSLKFSNRIEVKQSDLGTYIVNGEVVKKELLKSVFKKLIYENSDYIVMYNIRDNSTFQDYVDVIANFFMAVEELREEYMIKLAQDINYTYKFIEEAREVYPIRIFEITESMK